LIATASYQGIGFSRAATRNQNEPALAAVSPCAPLCPLWLLLSPVCVGLLTLIANASYQGIGFSRAATRNQNEPALAAAVLLLSPL